MNHITTINTGSNNNNNNNNRHNSSASTSSAASVSSYSTSSSSSTITRSPNSSGSGSAGKTTAMVNMAGGEEVHLQLPTSNTTSNSNSARTQTTTSAATTATASDLYEDANHNATNEDVLTQVITMKNSFSSSSLSIHNNHNHSHNTNDDDLSVDDDEEDNDDDLSIDQELEIILDETADKREQEPSTMFSEVSIHNNDHVNKTSNRQKFSFLRRRPSSNTLQKEYTTLPNTNSTTRRELNAMKRLQKQKEAEEELARRAYKRQMTSNQELWNALTMIPTPTYCLYFCLSGQWLTQNDIDQVVTSNSAIADWGLLSSGGSSSCIQSSYLPNLHTIPPLTVLAMTIAACLHSPCSMYYHLLCAYKLPPGPKRMDHWARRLDQAMIHFMSFMFAFATSANSDYFLITMAFNIDCMYRLFQKGMRPKQTLYRMIAAFFIPVAPLVFRGEWWIVMKLVIIYGISGWLFSAYPLGGWSHGAFHLVCFLSNPILIRSSLGLDVDVVRSCIDMAVKCSLVAK